MSGARYKPVPLVVGEVEYEARYVHDSPFGYPDDQRTEVWRNGALLFWVEGHPPALTLHTAIEAWSQAARPELSTLIELAAKAMAESRMLQWERIAEHSREDYRKLARVAAGYFTGIRPPAGER